MGLTGFLRSLYIRTTARSSGPSGWAVTVAGLMVVEVSLRCRVIWLPPVDVRGRCALLHGFSRRLLPHLRWGLSLAEGGRRRLRFCERRRDDNARAQGFLVAGTLDYFWSSVQLEGTAPARSFPLDCSAGAEGFLRSRRLHFVSRHARAAHAQALLRAFVARVLVCV
jgi:hypothetical protein